MTAVPATTLSQRLKYKLVRFLRNGFGLVPLVGMLALGVLISVLTVPFAPDGLGKRTSNWCFQVWARMTLWAFGVRVYVKGAENFRPGASYILAINHRSHLDLPVLGTVLNSPVAGVYKRSLGKVPLLGQALQLSRSVAIDRTQSRESKRDLAVLKHRLESGRSIIIFPEGRRSHGPQLLPFKKGAVVTAIEQGAEILPITIVGTDVAYPPNRLMVNPGNVVAIIHEPIRTVGKEMSERDALNDQVAAVVASVFAPGAPSEELIGSATRLL